MTAPQASTPDALFGVERSLGGRRWLLNEVDERRVAALSRALDGNDLLARLLAGRGVEPEDVHAFLDPKLRDLFPDPSVFCDMDTGAGHVLDAILDGRKVTVFADYDVDGGTSSAQLARYFRAWGRELGLYVPDRLKEGYGPSPDAFRQLKSDGVDLVITVDCGAAAIAALEEANRIDLPVIVIDHHLMQATPPATLAMINPNRPDCPSGQGHLAAAGVVFVFIVAMNRIARARGVAPAGGLPDPLEWLDLAALGTICDMAPLTGVNRAIVASGLKVLSRGDNPGLRALCDVANIARADSTYHAGFVLGPRLNAGGRIGDPWLAAKLLATDDRAEALGLAERLSGFNDARKAVERDILERALAHAEAELEHDPELPVVVAHGRDWHPGVVGIVAGRLKDRLHLPAIVIGYGEEIGPLAKGSARSVSGINIGGLIGEAARAGLIESGGGHAMAGGLSLRVDQIDPFTTWLRDRLKHAGKELAEARDMGIDAILAGAAATPNLIDVISRAGPYGAGAPEPRFVIRDSAVEHVRRIGENHLKFRVHDGTGSVDCIAWRAADSPLGEAVAPGARLHLVGRIKHDTWQGRDAVRFDVEDAAVAS